MLVFYLFLSVGISFLCSLFEAIILSASPAYIAAQAESGSRSGRMLFALKENIDDSLAAILTLNTISHTIGAAGVGAEVLKIYGSSYVAIASVILTLLILVLSEIIPKTLGATYWRHLAPLAAYGIRSFIVLTYPFVIAFQGLSRSLGKKSHETQVTREEVLFTAKIGRQEGSLSEEEVAIIQNVLRLRKIAVQDVMTPRTVVFSLEENQTLAEVLPQLVSAPFSRIPVYSGQIDKVTGLVMRLELLAANVETEGEKKLRDFARPLYSVPETMTVAHAFNAFIERGEHLFAVFDEHGGFDGLISLEDVIETLLGVEITDEFDSVEDLREYAAKRWKQRYEKAAG